MTSNYSVLVTLVLFLGSLVLVISKDFKKLDMKPGDIITCKFSPRTTTFWEQDVHWMLAIDADSVIHAFPSGPDEKLTAILEETRDNIVLYLKPLNTRKCKNIGATYEKDPLQAVEDAQRYTKDIHGYDPVTCNSEHWVNKWTKGHGGYSITSETSAAENCDAF